MGSIITEQVQKERVNWLAQLAQDRGVSPEQLINGYAKSMATRILAEALEPDGWQEAGERMSRLELAVTHFQDLLPLIPGNLTNNSSQR